MLTSPHGTRLVYEPANLVGEIFDGQRAAEIPMPRGDGPELRDVLGALNGQRRGPWVDQLNRCHIVRRSVVKDVRAISLAPLVAARRPDTPIVVLLRDPREIARSALRLKWRDRSQLHAAVTTEISDWCDRHDAALADTRLVQAHVVTYHRLVADPRHELAAIGAYARHYSSRWQSLNPMRVQTARPSSTSFTESRDDGTEEDQATIEEIGRRELERVDLLGLFEDVDPMTYLASWRARRLSRAQ